jgi:hypothetical protein
MALIIDEDLKPKPKAVSLPALITFTVSLRDNQAPENPTSTKPLPIHHLVMSLDPDSDLFFVVGGNRRKEAEFDEPIPRKSKELTFPLRLEGAGVGLVSFGVALDVPGPSGTDCLVDLL